MFHPSLPTIDDLLINTYTFSEREQELEADLMNKLNDTINGLQILNSSSADEITHFRYGVLAIVRFYIHEFSKEEGNTFVITGVSPNPIMGGTIRCILLTRHFYTFFDVIYNHIINNLIETGIFTEYWKPISCMLLRFAMHDRDIIIPDFSETDEYQDLLDRTFEANRVETMNKKFDTNNNWKIYFNPDNEPERRTDDNKDCLLCYERADFVCANCKYPLCSTCIEHLKHSTATCPSCQNHPLNLLRLEDGNWEIENDTSGKEFDENNNEEEVNEDNNEDNNEELVNEDNNEELVNEDNNEELVNEDDNEELVNEDNNEDNEEAVNEDNNEEDNNEDNEEAVNEDNNEEVNNEEAEPYPDFTSQLASFTDYTPFAKINDEEHIVIDSKPDNELPLFT